MRIVTENHQLRRQYEQIVALKSNLDFFSLLWVQDILHPQWAYVLDAADQIMLRVPVSKKFGIKAYLQPLFIRSLTYVGPPNQSALSELVAFLGKKNLLHLNLCSKPLMPAKSKIGIYQSLTLGKSSKNPKDTYSENVKRSLKKAKHLTVNGLDFVVFHRFFIQQKGANLGSLNAAAWHRLENLVAAASHHEAVVCLGAFDGEQLLAAGLFFKWDKMLYFIKGTLNEVGKKNGALVFLIDSVIEKFASSHEVLDFIGSNQEGIASFYRKFGAVDQKYSILKGRLPIV